MSAYADVETTVALGGDAQKMETPKWACFTAVETLTEYCATKAAVSSWGSVAVNRCVVASSDEQQLEIPVDQAATRSSIAISPSARYWLDQEVGSTTSICEGKDYTGGADCLPAAQPVAHILHGQAEHHSVNPSQFENKSTSKPCVVASSGTSMEVTTTSGHDGSIHKKSETHQSLILHDLSLRDFADWKKQRDCSLPSLGNKQSNAQAGVMAVSSEDQVMISTARKAPEILQSMRDSGSCPTAPEWNADASSQARSAVSSRKGRCSGQTTPVRALDQQSGTLASVPAIGSLANLSGGLIPQLPHVYSAMFPEFNAVSSLFWKFQYSRTKQLSAMDQRPHKPEHDTMLIESCLDHKIYRCEAWCAAHGPHGLVQPISENHSINSGHASQPSKQQTQAQKYVSPSKAELEKSRSHERYGGFGQAALCTATGSDIHRGHCTDAGQVAVPGWVPQIPTALTQQLWFCIVAGKDHPEVTEIVGKSLEALGWKQDECSKQTCQRGCSTNAAQPHMWNLCWTWSVRARVPEEVLTWQLVNHFQGCRFCPLLIE